MLIWLCADKLGVAWLCADNLAATAGAGLFASVVVVDLDGIVAVWHLGQRWWDGHCGKLGRLR